ncbi:RNA recognition motif protein (macronuclear) [Tetrahymena thermophila SB210]|uniref:RNA recognition motif protein n=1 Tax=Tetrahymena thermophila (strain SB210) TaxID=312017 RepID=Q22Z94_TETTS|nr:RNA recognition motif protein [Tetrahymena thermophila SB210]EAR90427.1 RNA recognition motif protein [Tetrahymena thermophila SB210]|eukprot:XP_001010672.1 RNA recognition motif protein [Tetrahymena thermophila SB210]
MSKNLSNMAERYQGESGVFTSLDNNDGDGPLKSVDGWLLFVTGLHEETTDDQIYDAFGEFGEIKNCHLNLDRRSGYVKGYALVQYENLQHAQDAIKGLNGTTILDRQITVDWAFKRPVKNSGRK